MSGEIIEAPGLHKVERPRWAGLALLNNIRKSMAEHPQAGLPETLDKMGLVWLETDTKICPALAKAMERTANLKWVRPSFQPSSGEGLDSLLHADEITLEFRVDLTTASYRGWIAEGSPAEWSVKLRESLESCRKPATVPVPWRAWREVERDGQKFLEPATSNEETPK